MPGFVEGKVVVVTGAGGGIGREIALALGSAGAKVVVNDIGASLTGDGRDSSAASKVVNEITERGGIAVANTDSIAEMVSANRIITTAVEHFGRIDAVINNAGILRDRLFSKMSEDAWTAVINVHLNGTFHVSRAAAPHFKEPNSGAFVHMTSTAGLIGNVGQPNYGAAKAGIAALSRSIAIEMSRYNVRSNCISPFAWSRMISSIPTDTPEQQERVSKLKQMDASKIAPLAVYLVSEQAKEVTGQIFSVRANEIFLMSQSRPLRGMQRSDGWTPETIAEHVIPGMKADFYGLEKSADVFSWDPI